MRTLAIGDIHGCNTALGCLLKTVQPQVGDRIVFLGDYIDRGPSSREVIETLLTPARPYLSVFLRGNHEAMILEAKQDPLKDNLWQSYGGLETLFSYGANYRADWASSIPDRHWEFFVRTKRFLETESEILVHACLDPELDMDQQPDWLLYWEFLERLKPHKSGKRVICGHTPQRSGEIKDMGFAVCINTGPAVGGWLSCLDVNSSDFWQANERGDARSGKL